MSKFGKGTAKQWHVVNGMRRLLGISYRGPNRIGTLSAFIGKHYPAYLLAKEGEDFQHLLPVYPQMTNEEAAEKYLKVFVE